MSPFSTEPCGFGVNHVFCATCLRPRGSGVVAAGGGRRVALSQLPAAAARNHQVAQSVEPAGHPRHSPQAIQTGQGQTGVNEVRGQT